MENATFMISILLCHEEVGWSAQCLEYDICAQGKTLPEVKAAFEKTFVGQIAVDVAKGIQPLSAIPQAPRMYWDIFQTADRLMDRKPFYIPPAYMVRAAAEDVRIAA